MRRRLVLVVALVLVLVGACRSTPAPPSEARWDQAIWDQATWE